jgi:hypothetical protein
LSSCVQSFEASRVLFTLFVDRRVNQAYSVALRSGDNEATARHESSVRVRKERIKESRICFLYLRSRIRLYFVIFVLGLESVSFIK